MYFKVSDLSLEVDDEHLREELKSTVDRRAVFPSLQLENWIVDVLNKVSEATFQQMVAHSTTSSNIIVSNCENNISIHVV